jgi:stringent starvation protein B
MKLTVVAGADMTGEVIVPASSVQTVWAREDGSVVELSRGRKWTVAESAQEVVDAREAELVAARFRRRGGVGSGS